MTKDEALTQPAQPEMKAVWECSMNQTSTTHPGLKPRVSHQVAPFVVVSNPGTIFELIEDYCGTLKAALECKGCYDDPCDVMRQLPSGELTTEF